MGGDERVVVRCGAGFKERFTGFSSRFDDHEAAIDFLLDRHERLEALEDSGVLEEGPTAATR